MIRRIMYLCISVCISAGLIISLPLVTMLVKKEFSMKKEPAIRKTEVKRIVLPQERQEKKKPLERPRKRLSPRTAQTSGPRFAMALGAQGLDGAGIELDMLAAANTADGTDDDGVDERPRPIGDLQVSVPEAVRQSEMNAHVRLLFCVDIAGHPYDIRISEEEPTGLGLAQAGREALSRTTFAPAMRGGKAVPFCGMEQPIEIKFRN